MTYRSHMQALSTIAYYTLDTWMPVSVGLYAQVGFTHTAGSTPRTRLHLSCFVFDNTMKS